MPASSHLLIGLDGSAFGQSTALTVRNFRPERPLPRTHFELWPGSTFLKRSTSPTPDVPRQLQLHALQPVFSRMDPPEHAPQSTSPKTGSKRRASSKIVGYPRKRAAVACSVCRARRTKCDQKRPRCSFCEESGATCVFEPSNAATLDSGSLTILDRLDQIERKLDHMARSPVERSTNGATSSLVGNELMDDEHAIKVEACIPQSLDAVAQWPVFHRHGIDVHLYTTPGRSSPPSSTGLIDLELDNALCERLLDNYFSYVHTKNPIFDEKDARRLVRKVAFAGARWDAESTLALLVCATGAQATTFETSLEPMSNENDLVLAHTLYIGAERRLGPLLGASGVISAQCFFLAGVYLMAAMRPFDAWRMFFQAVAQCQQIDLVRSRRRVSISSPASTHSVTTAEESIYWSAWKSEQELRTELGFPELETLMPPTPNQFPNPPEGCEGDNLRAWYFYLAEISLWRLEKATRQRILNCAKNNHQSLPAFSAIAYDVLDQIEAWQGTLVAPIDISKPLEAQHDGDILKFILRGRITYIHEMISWPFIHASIIDNISTSLDVDEWVRKGAYFHYQRIVMNNRGFYHRHHGTWFQLRSSARSVLILFALGRASENLELLPVEWMDHIETALAMFRYWSTHYKDILPVLRLLESQASLYYDSTHV